MSTERDMRGGGAVLRRRCRPPIFAKTSIVVVPRNIFGVGKVRGDRDAGDGPDGEVVWRHRHWGSCDRRHFHRLEHLARFALFFFRSRHHCARAALMENAARLGWARSRRFPTALVLSLISTGHMHYSANGRRWKSARGVVLLPSRTRTHKGRRCE
jgi:hypothetical protein